MIKRYVVLAMVCACALMQSVLAQAPAKVDFGRDVLPIFRQDCVGCHGPSQQMNGLRLDRKSSVFKNGLRRVVPGSSENSFLYHRLVGAEFGVQMPLTGPLRPEQINTIKTWIDQGADWPDALANEADSPPPNPKAVAMIEALRVGDRQSFMKLVAEDAKLLNAHGPEGSTPLMYAVIYSDAAMLEQLLKKGADPNARNDANATALLWAATDLEKTRVLVSHGADVNVRSDGSHTPLMVAAGRPGGTPIVKLLLEHGANPNPTKNPSGEGSPLVQSVLASDAETLKLLMDHGADVKGAAFAALAIAVTTKCSKCVDLLVASNLDKEVYTVGLFQTAMLGDINATRLMVDHGGDVHAVDPVGRTPIMYAVASDTVSADVVKFLIDHGADVNAKSQHQRSGDSGQTVLDLAKLHGDTAVVDLLIKAGAKAGGGRTVPAVQPLRENSIRSAIQRSLPLIQRADAGFSAKSGCVSCHNNSLEGMAVGLARKSGFRVDEQIASQQVKFNLAYLEHQRENLHQSYFAAQAGAEAVGDIFGPGILGYILVGLDAEHHKPDLNTDAAAIYLKARQMPDGWWAYGTGDERPPICSAYIGQTALIMRALQLYAPKIDKAGYEKSIQLAATWLAKAEPKNMEDRFWQLQGLAWAGRDKDAITKALRDVQNRQRPDGGWSELPSMESNAYSTGRALVALQNAGLPVSDPTYQRGVKFLLEHQLEDGSWYVKTRAAGFQPYFETGLPHGVDQFISAAGTSWATMALTLAAQSPASSVVARGR